MSVELANQFTEICTRLAGSVAERVQESTMGLSRNERRRIEKMLEDDLPNIVFNSMRKTVSLQNQEGLDYVQNNFERLVEMYVRKIMGKD
jgi:hypothetical protein